MIKRFVPQHFIDNFNKVKEKNYIEVKGFVMFADLSGFTAMSEKLSKKADGSEKISEMLNSIFEQVITLIHSYNGSVYKFGGDALTVFFDSKNILYNEILTCSFKIINIVKEYKKSNRINIGIKIGLSYGNCYIGQIGEAEKQYFLFGETLDNACDSEHLATPGEIVVHKEFLSIIKETQVTNKIFTEIKREECNNCFFKVNIKRKNLFINDKESPSKIRKIKSKTLHKNSIKELQQFTNKIFLDKDSFGVIQKGELRNCTILFINFEGYYSNNDKENKDFDYNLLNQFYIETYNCISKYGGFINKIDMGDKGSKIITLFGAPITTEKNEEFALRSMAELKSLLLLNKKLYKKLKINIGIHSGPIYYGIIGAEERKEFTVIGSSVNLSARMMVKANPNKNEVICSETVKNKVSFFKYSDERTVIFKGVEKKFKIFSFDGIQEKENRSLKNNRIRIIGRIEEQKKYNNILDKYENSDERGIIVNISAEAGMGKSILSENFYQKLVGQKRFNNVILVNCLSYTKENSFYIIREIINSFLKINEKDKLNSKLGRLEKLLISLAENKNLLIYSYFLDWQNYPDDLKFDESLKDLFTNISIKIFNHYLATDNKQERVSLFIDDLHWIDESSLELLKMLLPTIEDKKFLIHFIYRPEDKANYFENRKLFNSETMKLDKLGFEEGKSFLLKKFNLTSISDNLYKKIYDTTKGNPFFSEEIILSLKNEKSNFIPVEMVEGIQFYKLKPNLKINIPDNLQEIILSRIDKLDENSKTILKIASVIGRVFQFNILKQLQDLKELASRLNIKEKLFDLTKMNLTLFEENSNNNEYLFKHIVTRDVAYNTLLFSIRKNYHERIGLLFEENYKGNLTTIYETLANHYRLSNNKEKAKFYVLKSAEKSLSKFSYKQAIKYLNLYRKFKITKEEKTETYFKQIEILKILEKRDKGIEFCEKIKEMYDESSYEFQKAVILKGELFRRGSEFDNAIKEIVLIKKYANLEIELEAKTNLGYAYILTGKIDKLEIYLHKFEIDIKRTKDKYIKTLGIKLLGYHQLYLRNISSAIKYYKKVNKLATDNDFLTLKLQSIQDIGVCFAQMGQYKKAERYFITLNEESNRIHNIDLILSSIDLLSQLAQATGEYEIAEKHIDIGLKKAEYFNKNSIIEALLGNLSDIKLELNKYDEVLDLCDVREKIVKKTNNNYSLSKIHDIKGDALFKKGLFDKALNIYKVNLKLNKKIKDKEGLGHTYGNIANCYAELGFHSKSLRYYKLHLEYSIKNDDKQSEGKANFNIAYTSFHDIKDTEKALEFCKKAVKIFKKINFTYGLEAAEDLLKEIKKETP